MALNIENGDGPAQSVRPASDCNRWNARDQSPRRTSYRFAPILDGYSLLVAQGEIDQSYGFYMLVNRDVYVLDAETLRERIHVRIDQVDQLWFDGFSPDGRYAYLRGSLAQWVEGGGWRDWRTVRQLLDLNSYRLISAGESGSRYGALLHIAP